MARRTSTTKQNDTTTEAPAEVENPTQEAPVSTDTTEVETTDEAVTEDATEAPAEAKAEKKADKPIDLEPFKAVVATAMEAHDSSTGVVPEENLGEVTTSYRALDGVKAKNTAKTFINEKLKDAVNRLEMGEGKAYMMISEALTAGAAAAKEKVPTDPTEAYVQRLVTLSLAWNLVNNNSPEGVDEADAKAKTDEQVSNSLNAAQTYFGWLHGDEETRGDEPEVSGIVKSAVKLASGKAAKAGGRTSSGTAYTGARRDIGEHIRQAFADHETGTFLSVAEIRKFKSTEYGDDQPSAGAISARLFPKDSNGAARPCTLDFVEPGQNDAGKHGATKK